MNGPLALSYVLPLRSATARSDLAPYLRSIAEQVDDVVVVDGSPPDVFGQHAAAWGDAVRQVPVDPSRRTAMGKVGGVLTGIDVARHDKVVIADEDVRWEPVQLEEMDRLLDEAEVVRPQNWFDPLPWHARWDTGRILLGRALGGDWPGTLGVQRSLVQAVGGYDGDVLFENYELVRTVVAAGGRAHLALGLLVRREPSTTRQFLDQRVRHAYDEWARPWRLAVSMAVLPAALARPRRVVPAVVATSVAVAELGRRRANGTRVFPATSALWAPVWVAERAVTSWLAFGARLRGGVRYRDTRLRRAATPTGELRRRVRRPLATR